MPGGGGVDLEWSGPERHRRGRDRGRLLESARVARGAARGESAAQPVGSDWLPRHGGPRHSLSQGEHENERIGETDGGGGRLKSGEGVYTVGSKLENAL